MTNTPIYDQVVKIMGGLDPAKDEEPTIKGIRLWPMPPTKNQKTIRAFLHVVRGKRR